MTAIVKGALMAASRGARWASQAESQALFKRPRRNRLSRAAFGAFPGWRAEGATGSDN